MSHRKAWVTFVYPDDRSVKLFQDRGFREAWVRKKAEELDQTPQKPTEIHQVPQQTPRAGSKSEVPSGDPPDPAAKPMMR